MYYSVLNFNIFLPIGGVDKFPGFLQNSLEKRQVAACHSSKKSSVQIQ
jgi:hypothetical protein